MRNTSMILRIDFSNSMDSRQHGREYFPMEAYPKGLATQSVNLELYLDNNIICTNETT